MRLKRTTDRDWRRIVQEEDGKEEKEEEEVAHPIEFEQLREMDAESSSLF